MQPPNRVDMREALRYPFNQLGSVRSYAAAGFGGRAQQEHERHFGKINHLLS